MANNLLMVPPALQPRPAAAPSNSGNPSFVVPPQGQRAPAPLDRFAPTGLPAPAVGGAVPAPGAPPQLLNEGGKVLTNAVFVPLYFGDYWTTWQGVQDSLATDAFAQEFGTSAMAQVVGPYGVGPASFGGSTHLTGTPPQRMTDADVQAAVKQALASGAVSPTPQGVYTVFLPPGTQLQDPEGEDSTRGLGGYHASYVGADGQPVYYAAIVYGQRGNGIDFDDVPQDNISIAASHEWTEAQTDPDINSAAGLPMGWYDRANDAEIGDLAIKQLPFNETFQKDAAGHAVQLEWSNQDQGYEIAPSSPKEGFWTPGQARGPGSTG